MAVIAPYIYIIAIIKRAVAKDRHYTRPIECIEAEEEMSHRQMVEDVEIVREPEIANRTRNCISLQLAAHKVVFRIERITLFTNDLYS